MTAEQIAALKVVAEKAQQDNATPRECDNFFKSLNPTTCLQLVEEVERLQKAFDELYGYWQDAVTEPSIKQKVGKGLMDAFRGDPRYQKEDKK